MSTVKAPFGGGIPLVNLDEGTPIPCRFVLKLSDKLTPSDIRDGFCQTVVLNHILDVQTLDTYDLVFAYDASRELVLIVPSPVGNLFMDASNFETSCVPVLGTFFLVCVTPLRFRQLLFILREELGIAGGVPIGGDDHRLQTQVKPYHLGGDFQRFDVFFYQDGDKRAFGFIFGDGDTAWLASIRQGAVPHDVKRSIHLGKGEMMPVPGERIAGIGSGLLIPLLFEGGIVSTPFKEVAESFIKMPESLLQGNRRNLIEPHRLFLLFEQDQPLRGVLVGQTLTTLVVGIGTLAQCPVVDIAATSEGVRQDALLFITWIEAILEGFLLVHALQYSIHPVKCHTVSLPISPRKVGPSIPVPKGRGFTGRRDNQGKYGYDGNATFHMSLPQSFSEGDRSFDSVCCSVSPGYLPVLSRAHWASAVQGHLGETCALQGIFVFRERVELGIRGGINHLDRS